MKRRTFTGIVAAFFSSLFARLGWGKQKIVSDLERFDPDKYSEGYATRFENLIRGINAKMSGELILGTHPAPFRPSLRLGSVSVRWDRKQQHYTFKILGVSELGDDLYQVVVDNNEYLPLDLRYLRRNRGAGVSEHDVSGGTDYGTYRKSVPLALGRTPRSHASEITRKMNALLSRPGVTVRRFYVRGDRQNNLWFLEAVGIGENGKKPEGWTYGGNKWTLITELRNDRPAVQVMPESYFREPDYSRMEKHEMSWTDRIHEKWNDMGFTDEGTPEMEAEMDRENEEYLRLRRLDAQAWLEENDKSP